MGSVVTPGHIARNCPEPRVHRIRASHPTPTPTPPMEDLRATIVDIVKTTMAELSHTTPPLPSEPEAPTEEGNEDF